MDSRTFPAWLKAAREAKGWSQTDLARAIWGSIANRKGYLVARNRDRISCYENGKSLPNARHLKQMCDALGVPPPDLGPERRPPPPKFLMTESAKPGNAFVQINMDMPYSIAAAICERLGEISP